MVNRVTGHGLLVWWMTNQMACYAWLVYIVLHSTTCGYVCIHHQVGQLNTMEEHTRILVQHIFLRNINIFAHASLVKLTSQCTVSIWTYEAVVMNSFQTMAQTSMDRLKDRQMLCAKTTPLWASNERGVKTIQHNEKEITHCHMIWICTPHGTQ